MSHIYPTKKYSKTYITKSLKIFDEYKNYIQKKYFPLCKNKLNKKIFLPNNHIYDMENIRDFLINRGSTLPRRIIRWIVRPYLKLRYIIANRLAIRKIECNAIKNG